MRTMNKKASFFEVGLVAVVLIAMTMAMFAFFDIKDKMGKSIEPPSELLNIYNEKTKIMLYEDESARLASQNAFNSIIGEVSSGECTIIQMNYVLWNDKCKPDTEKIKNSFFEKFNILLLSFIKSYSTTLIKNLNFVSSSIDNNKINLNIESITLKISSTKGYVKYNSSFIFDPSFIFDLSSNKIVLSDFEDIYSNILICKNKDITKTQECLAGKFDRWDFSINSYDKYLLFDFKTKESYLLDNKISKISLKFAVEI